MILLRALARRLPRTIGRPSAATVRPLLAAPRFTNLHKPVTSLPKHSCFSFSTSATRRETAGEFDQELCAKIDQEILLEKESRDPEQIPSRVQSYLDSGPFQVEDMAGSNEVSLTRQFGDEIIKVTFLIDAINNIDDDAGEMQFEDPALDDEDGSLAPNMDNSNSKRSVNQIDNRREDIRIIPEDSLAPADRAAQAQTDPEIDDMAAEDEDTSPLPSTELTITISKPNKGAVKVIAFVQDGMVEFGDVFYFPQADVADSKTAEKEHAGKRIYAGPPFANLDSDLQQMIERYLDERGINSQLALFVPDYIEYKEQREYVKWLENMRDFVEG